jgi:hypothetical protein
MFYTYNEFPENILRCCANFLTHIRSFPDCLIDYLRFYVPLKNFSMVDRGQLSTVAVFIDGAINKPVLQSNLFKGGLGFYRIFEIFDYFSMTNTSHKIVILLSTAYVNGDVTIAREGLQNLGLCSALMAFEQGGSSCHTCCDTGPRFYRSHPKDSPI